MPSGIWHKGVPRATQWGSHRHYLLILCGCLALASVLNVVPDQLFAETRVVTGEGLHRLSDRETKDDGVRLAAEQAKRQALEQVATYLESITVVRNLDVTQDELRSYTAGMVLVLDQQTKTLLEEDTVVIKVILTAQVDTDEVNARLPHSGKTRMHGRSSSPSTRRSSNSNRSWIARIRHWQLPPRRTRHERSVSSARVY